MNEMKMSKPERAISPSAVGANVHRVLYKLTTCLCHLAPARTPPLNIMELGMGKRERIFRVNAIYMSWDTMLDDLLVTG
jgi:hypothetical protein